MRNKILYLNQIEAHHQQDFTTIKDYNNELKTKFTEYCFSEKFKKIGRKRLEEYFLRGLHPIAREEAILARGNTRAEITELISEIEQLILDEFLRRPVKVPTPVQTPVKNKYCKRHGNGLYSTEECHSLKKARAH